MRDEDVVLVPNMHRGHKQPACFTRHAWWRTWGRDRDATWCKAWADRSEMLRYQPGCDGCARAPHTWEHPDDGDQS